VNYNLDPVRGFCYNFSNAGVISVLHLYEMKYTLASLTGLTTILTANHAFFDMYNKKCVFYDGSNMALCDASYKWFVGD
jgi:hypothetical protein